MPKVLRFLKIDRSSLKEDGDRISAPDGEHCPGASELQVSDHCLKPSEVYNFIAQLLHG